MAVPTTTETAPVPTPPAPAPAAAAPTPTEPVDPDIEGLGDAGKAAIQRERAAAKAAETRARLAEARAQEFEDRDKSEAQKLQDERDRLRAENERLQLENLRRDVAAEKGLTLAQAKRLTGSTRDELETDADDLLATFPSTPTPQTPTQVDVGQGYRGNPVSRSPQQDFAEWLKNARGA